MPREPLVVEEREEIRAGLSQGWSCRSIARALGRAPSTVSREIARNGGPAQYRATVAQRRAEARRARPKTPKLMADQRLARTVTGRLQDGYSPAGVAALLARQGGARVCHETIYQALYSPVFVGLGLRGQDCLRTRRRRRRRRGGRDRSQGRHRHFGAFKLIDLRPAGAADRSEPGHWEGDLIIGAHKASAIATLVERTSRLTLMADLPSRHRPAELRAALSSVLGSQPPSMLRSLTWDQGIEMCDWAGIEHDLGIAVYFCHPHSPWQRPTNEHTNRQLRYWLPKSTDLSVHGQQRLDRICRVLNTQPRRSLHWLTPIEVYDHHAVALTA